MLRESRALKANARALERLQAGWSWLAARRGAPMQHFIWALAFAQTYAHAGRIRIIVAGHEATPAALAALVEPPGFGGALEALGVRYLFEPCDLLSTGADSLAELARALARQPRALAVPRIRADSPAVAALIAAYDGRGFVRVVPTDGYPYVDLDAGWKQPESKFDAGRRSDFRRARRRAEQLGRVSFETLAPQPAELPMLLREAFAVEAAGWKGERGSALSADTRRGEFFRRYAAAACGQGLLRLAFMRIDGRAVAMQIAAESANRLWLLKIGYDEAAARCSPGQQLMLHVIGEAARRELDSVEFLGQAEPWTQLWTRAVRPCVSLRAYPFTFRGMATLALDGFRFTKKNFRAAAAA
jgi:CelD/BcsL family acetyltransferase involved in cellulose biosynthesis